MWSISRALFVVALAYAAVGSVVTVTFGRPLVRLNYDQLDREASFRTELVHVGENAESVALLHREGRLGARLGRRIDALVANTKRIIAVNRNVAFFTTGYNYGIQLVPALIIGPLFIRGEVPFGVITQSAMAFAHLLGAFSLIVTQFQSLSSYAAVLTRLGTFSEAVDPARGLALPEDEPTDEPNELVYEDLTLRSRRSGETLVEHLSLSIDAGTRLLVTGTEEARRALFRATALERTPAEGKIHRPAAPHILFLPERPFVPPGTLRELVVPLGREWEISDAAVRAALRDLALERTLDRLGGLDVEADYDHLLSLSEQQLLAIARILIAAPAFAILQNPGSTLAPEQLARALELFSAASINYVTFGAANAARDAYDAVLELHAGGAWELSRSTAPVLHSAS
jgi:putative ATP-binding cassette transporter